MLVLRRSDVITSPRWAARDPYARVVNIGTNNDGHTKEGITFPSSDAQGQLARQVHQKSLLLRLLSRESAPKLPLESHSNVSLKQMTTKNYK